MKTLKPSVFLISLAPFLYLLYLIFFNQDKLTADPVKYILHETGIWSLRFLLITLAMTPLRQIFNQVFFIKIRRMLGLFTFFYASLHIAIYLGLDLGLDFAHLWEDIVKRPYITVGFLAWLIMVPMAITSNKKMMRKLGKKWKKLHQSIYLVCILSCLHFIWLVKKDLVEPLIYAAIAAVLLIFRVVKHLKK